MDPPSVVIVLSTVCICKAMGKLLRVRRILPKNKPTQWFSQKMKKAGLTAFVTTERLQISKSDSRDANQLFLTNESFRVF